ncbi:MAG: CBS domain-containing protein [Candidatus Sericytochromatia bacterium]
MKVKELMTSKLSFCTSETSLQEVAKMMKDEDCGAIPVVDNKDSLAPKGIITDRDIVIRSLADSKNPMDLKVSDCMTSNVFTIDSESNVEDCYSLMSEHQVRRIIVIENGKVKGIVAQADIAVKASEIETAKVVERVSQPA